MPKVSIVIPVYNAERDIRRCLDSIIAQNYKDWECLLVNDGSPDNSGLICEEYAQRDKRFRVFNKENGGPSTARNFGLDKASGDYICFIDSDDYVSVSFLEHLILPMEKDKDVKITVTGLVKFGAEEAKFPAIPNTETISSKMFFDHLLRGDIVKGWLCNKCFRKSIIGSLRLNENLRFCEDLELQLRLAYFEPEFKVRFVCGYDYYYYIQGSTISLSHNVRNKVIMIDKLNDCLEIYPDSASKRIRILKGCYNQCRSLVKLNALQPEEEEIIKKAKYFFVKYKRDAWEFFDRRKKMQIFLIMLSFRLYKRIINQ